MSRSTAIMNQRILLGMVAIALLVVFGLFAFSPKPSGNTANNAALAAAPQQSGSSGQFQDIYIRALQSGTYDKGEITVRRGAPVRLHFSADPGAGCGRQLVIYGLNVTALSQNGEEKTVEFTPLKEGTFEYNCGMRMFRPGKLVVVP